MVRARRMEDWNHTASLMALIANANRKKGSKAYTPDDFHPLRSSRKGGRVSVWSEDTFWMLKSLLPPDKRSKKNGAAK